MKRIHEVKRIAEGKRDDRTDYRLIRTAASPQVSSPGEDLRARLHGRDYGGDSPGEFGPERQGDRMKSIALIPGILTAIRSQLTDLGHPSRATLHPETWFATVEAGLADKSGGFSLTRFANHEPDYFEIDGCRFYQARQDACGTIQPKGTIVYEVNE